MSSCKAMSRKRVRADDADNADMHTAESAFPPLAVATDCSGIECPLMALQSLEIPYIHKFSSELDRATRRQLLANHAPQTMYEDMLQRDADGTAFAHLYVAGFSCQPFSMAGSRLGLKDRRASVFWGCVAYIRNREPWCWLLENVEGLASHNGGETLQTILSTLQSINGGRYLVEWRILNTEEHGVPQHRKRIYFLGIRRDRIVAGCEFQWPEPVPCRGLEEFLDAKEPASLPQELPNGPAMALALWRHRIQRAHGELEHIQHEIVLDVDASLDMINRCPCLIRSRPQGYWLVGRQRRMRVAEMLRLQGMPDNLRQVASDSELARMVGNSMSLNVLERLLVRLLPAVGLAAPGQLVDRFGQATAAVEEGHEGR